MHPGQPTAAAERGSTSEPEWLPERYTLTSNLSMQESRGPFSRNMVNGQGLGRCRPASRASPVGCAPPGRRARRCAAMSPRSRCGAATKASTATSLAALKHGRQPAAGRSASMATRKAGKRPRSGSSKVRVPTAARSSLRAPLSIRCGIGRGNGRSARACPAGPAPPSPSRPRRRPARARPTADAPRRRAGRRDTPKRWCASMSSSPLFIRPAESIVTLGPMAQFGCARASSSVAAAIRSAVQVAERPARGRQGHPLDRGPVGVAERLEDGIVLAVERQQRAPCRFAAAMTAAPAQTSVSLLARAMVRPASMAAKVGRMPAVPGDGADDEVAGPPRRLFDGLGAGRAGDAGPGQGGLESRIAAGRRGPRSAARSVTAILARAAASRPPATAATLKASGCSFRISAVERPIEPVAPRITSVFGAEPDGAGAKS